jgi:hypothetical protein
VAATFAEIDEVDAGVLGALDAGFVAESGALWL